MRISNLLLTLTGCLTLCAAAQGQTVLKNLYGNSAQDEFGYAMKGAGDVNHDGFDDFIVGARWEDNSGTNSGTAWVYSGKNFSVLYMKNGDTQYDHLGTSVSGAGDVDHDGFADFITGNDGDDNNGAASGSARVFSGKTGATLYTFNGDDADDVFGTAVSGAGDVDHDGFDDVIVGAPWDDNAGINSGMARVFSGKTGAILYTFDGTAADDNFGFTVSGAGDVDADGYADVIVGAPYADPNGSSSGLAKVFSGRTGAALYTFKGAAASDSFGYSVSGAGDVDGDGNADVIVGAPFADVSGSESGMARVYSGRNGSILRTFSGDSSTDLAGTSVSGGGDVNGDGYADLVVGAPWDDFGAIVNAGTVKVYSGRNGNLLFTFSGNVSQVQFGSAVAHAGDANGDGLADVLGATYLDATGGTHAGMVRLFSPCPFPVKTYCTAKVNSLGCTPAIAATGVASASSLAPFLITGSQIVNQKAGLLFYGANPAAMPFNGGTLCVAPPTKRTAVQSSGGAPTGSSCTGVFSLDFNARIRSGIDPALTVGEQICAQWWYRDGAGYGLSDAVQFTICN
jgi:FG-GAP repeat protein